MLSSGPAHFPQELVEQNGEKYTMNQRFKFFFFKRQHFDIVLP